MEKENNGLRKAIIAGGVATTSHPNASKCACAQACGCRDGNIFERLFENSGA